MKIIKITKHCDVKWCTACSISHFKERCSETKQNFNKEKVKCVDVEYLNFTLETASQKIFSPVLRNVWKIFLKIVYHSWNDFHIQRKVWFFVNDNDQYNLKTRKRNHQKVLD